ncbi:MAG: MBOAT family protein [Nanoarchaeota archaeon]|nr:MBOAT family protein [Nanoarchaeota archaeon]
MIFLFHSFDFLFFFAIVFIAFWVLPKRFKNAALLISSYIFFGSWNWKLLGLILISTYVDFFCGLLIHRAKSAARRKHYLLLSIVTNLSLLGFFKYYNFFAANLVTLLNTIGLDWNFSTLNIILPIGISFYTFQTMSYTIDIYRRKFEPTRNIIDFSLFVAYFPQLIAGPIERARRLLPLIQAKKRFAAIEWREGMYLFIYGLVKKVVFADSAGRIVESVFMAPEPSGAQVLIAAYAFAIQIYCDFSGYSNMARGISHFFGMKLSTNFNLPYLATNPSDFWRRWHITLSSWVKDYLYIPLGGRRSRLFGMVALYITWALMGLWHGAAWTFVVWGVYWGFLIMLYRVIKRLGVVPKARIFKPITIFLMFHLTCFSWIIFRSQSMGQAIQMFKALAGGINFLEFAKSGYVYLYAIIIFLVVYEVISYLKNDQLFLYKKNFFIQMVFYLILFFLFIEIGAVSDIRFIYFQF